MTTYDEYRKTMRAYLDSLAAAVAEAAWMVDDGCPTCAAQISSERTTMCPRCGADLPAR